MMLADVSQHEDVARVMQRFARSSRNRCASTTRNFICP